MLSPAAKASIRSALRMEIWDATLDGVEQSALTTLAALGIPEPSELQLIVMCTALLQAAKTASNLTLGLFDEY